MGEIRVIDACVECGGTSFTDLPEGSATARWGAEAEHPHCVCDNCGAWFWQEAVLPELRTSVIEAPADGNYRAMFKELRDSNPLLMAREIARAEAKLASLHARQAASKGELLKGGRK